MKETKERSRWGRGIIKLLANLWGDDVPDGPETTIGHVRQKAREQNASDEAMADIEATWEREKAILAAELIAITLHICVGGIMVLTIGSRDISTWQFPWTAAAAMTAHIGGMLLWSRMDRVARCGGHSTMLLGTWIAGNAL